MDPIVTATSVVVGSDDPQVISPPGKVANVEAFSSTDPGRITQQQLLPNAVRGRSVGSIFSNNPISSDAGSGFQNVSFLRSGTTTIFTFTLRDNYGRELIAVPDISFYIGGISAANQWPNRTYGLGNMPAYQGTDWGQTDNFNVVARGIIRNNAGEDLTVTCVCRFRILTVPSNISQLTPGTPAPSSRAGDSQTPGQGGGRP